MIKISRYFILALMFCMFLASPIQTIAAEGKISYLEEIQSVSAGDVQPYALMTLDEDYGVMSISDTVFSNLYPDHSRSVVYNPSFQTTVEVLSINFWTGNLTGLTGNNHIRMHIPFTISGLSSDDVLLKGEVWLLKDGKKYILGNYDNPWLSCVLDDLAPSDGTSLGIDLHLMNKEIYDYLYNDMWINPDDSSPSIYDTFYVQPQFTVDKEYLDELMRNRGKPRLITVSCSGGSYMCEYFEREEVHILNLLNSNLLSWFNQTWQYMSGEFLTLRNLIDQKFTDLFTKLDDIFATDNEVLSGAMDDYQAAEQEVFSPAMSSLSDFDFETNNIGSLGNGFVAAITFVSSCMSTLYDLTLFSTVFGVIATLGLASICIGLSRLWFGKDGK